MNADVGRALDCRVTATNTVGVSVSQTGNQIVVVPRPARDDADRVAPVLSGVRLSRARFPVGRHATPLATPKRLHAPGTVISLPVVREARSSPSRSSAPSPAASCEAAPRAVASRSLATSASRRAGAIGPSAPSPARRRAAPTRSTSPAVSAAECSAVADTASRSKRAARRQHVAGHGPPLHHRPLAPAHVGLDERRDARRLGDRVAGQREDAAAVQRAVLSGGAPERDPVAARERAELRETTGCRCSLLTAFSTTRLGSSCRLSVLDRLERRVRAEVLDPPAVRAQCEPEGDQAEIVLLSRRAGEDGARARCRVPSPRARPSSRPRSTFEAKCSWATETSPRSHRAPEVVAGRASRSRTAAYRQSSRRAAGRGSPALGLVEPRRAPPRARREPPPGASAAGAVVLADHGCAPRRSRLCGGEPVGQVLLHERAPARRSASE